MTSSKARKSSIEINFNGMFVTSPFAYEGGEIKALDNLDFTSMEYSEFSDFLKKETDADCSGIYYVIPGKELHNGLRLIKSDSDFKIFVDYGHRSKRRIALYLEHFDEDLTEYLEGVEDVVNHKVDESENETDSMSDDDDDDDVDDDDDDDDEDDESEDTASIDHLSADEVELSELRKKKRARTIEPIIFGSGRNSLFDADVDELSKEDTMVIEHESFLNELSMSLQKQTHNNIKNDGVKYPRHNPRIYWKLMKPILGERYESPQQLKECITNYAVANGYQIWFERNDHMRLLARCSKRAHDDETKCPWRLWATWMGNEKSFQVKSLVDEHKCARHFKSASLVNYKWIANKFASKITQDPEIKLVDLQAAVLKKYKCQVSIRLCHKARAYALSEYEQGGKLHYGKLWEYAEEIKRSNPGSTVKMNVKVNPDDGKTYFQGFYVCFQGLKEGWKHGCRRVLGLGECCLKSVYKGVLLSAVGRDANNQIYPVAWAVVNVENKENWSWFLKLIKKDLNLDDGTGVTLISNEHMGVIEAVNDVLPQAEHRQCARHIYDDFTEKFTGGQFRRLFWEACKASYPQQFDKVMEEIRVENPDAYQYLMDKDPSTWSRVFFQTNVGCDAVENGISECFNSLIFDLRRKPIVTLLESIRVIVMDRMSKMRVEAENWDDDICPTIRKKLEHTKELERFWRVIPCGGSLFEVKHGADIFMVDEIGKTCSCRTWQLSGLPCPHAIAAIFYINKLPETYVSDWFRMKMWNEAYSHHVKPLNGIKMWPETKGVTPLAQKPAVNTPKKRGKLRKRKRDAMEVYVSSGSGAMVAHVSGGGVVVHSSGGGTVDREGRRMTCKKCLQVGHNVRSCKNEKRDSPRKEARQAGRKKVIIVSEGGGGGRTGGRGGRRGRGGGRKGLFGSDHITEDDVIGCGDDIPLAVWPPLGVPLLLDKQHVEVAKQEETGMELTLENQEESGMELTSQNKGVEVRDKEASTNKDEGPISHGVEDPIPIKVEGSPPPIPHEEDKGPIPIQVEDPIPHKDQDTPSNKDQEPIQIKEQDPSIISEDQGPIPIEVEDPEDQEPIPTKEQEPSIIHEDQGPIPIEVEVEDPISHEDHESIPTKDQKPISNGEHEHQEFIPNEAKESIPSRNEDKKPILDKVQEPMANEDEKPIPDEGQEPTPHEDKESIPILPQKEMRSQVSTSERIVKNRLRNGSVEKDGEGSSSMEKAKAVMLDN
ncbi:uncharacterized protein LOC111912463 [Lactuca sativa]|uniref:SWIM-type domain-containing protein n=1 Tax=Lactuca sativa TaxID=4236 RepID=A0A9R1VHI1_LACSA|nr:uncharacterized protein LOC111912463 [Lactuca sativa]KAJ0207337.1 hypothetical protein LSAT_V11C500272300 [Lactuca sativa]